MSSFKAKVTAKPSAKPAAKSERVLPAIKPDGGLAAVKKVPAPTSKADKLPDVGPQQRQQRLSREKEVAASNSNEHKKTPTRSVAPAKLKGTTLLVHSL